VSDYQALLDETNTVLLVGEIDEEKVEQVLSDLKLADSRAIAKASDYRPPQIQLLVSSHGGRLPGAMAIADFIHMIETPVHTYALGLCWSAAMFVVAAGAKGHRYSARGTLFFTHPPLGGRYGSPQEVKAYAESFEKTAEEAARRLAEYATPKGEQVTPERIEQMQELLNSDHWLRPQEAVDLGLIDQIYTPSAAKQHKDEILSILENMDEERGPGAVELLKGYAELTDEDLAELQKELQKPKRKK
jgi:ATP-dependent Clp protease protease subunit